MSRRIVLGGLLGGLAATAGVALTATAGWLIVSASAQPVILTLLVAIVAVRTFGIARPALRYAERLVSHDAALTDLQQRRVAAYRRLIPLTPARLGRRARSDRLTGVVGDLDDQVDGQVRGVVPAVSVSVAALLGVILLTGLLAPAGLALVAALALIAGVSWWGYRDELAGHTQELTARGAVSRAAVLVTVNAGEVQAVHARADAGRLLDDAQAALVSATRRRARARARTAGLTVLALGLCTVAVAALVVHSGLTPPVAALVVLTPVALADAAVVLPDATGALARATAAATRLGVLTDQQPAVTARGRAAAPEPPFAVDLHEVRATWDGARVVGPYSLHLAPGEHVALVGPNGCGKSTLLALLARHLDPLTGEVEVDGVPLQHLDLASWRSRVAVVDDEPHVFASTVRANLVLARPDASDADVVEALHLAGLGGWHAALSDGLDTALGEHGRGLSGGERARLAVARALLSQRPLLLLDEPVAHLDAPTATAVLADLFAASRGRTVVVATHHPDGLDLVDRVLDLSAAYRGGEMSVAG